MTKEFEILREKVLRGTKRAIAKIVAANEKNGVKLEVTANGKSNKK